MHEPRTETYIVAALPFTIEMESRNPLWSGMYNYHPFIRQGGGSDTAPAFTLSVTDEPRSEQGGRLLTSRRSHENGADNMDIYLCHDGRYRFELFQNSCRAALLLAGPPFRKAEVAVGGSPEQCREALNSAVMLAYILATAAQGALLLHASVVVNDGRAYVFMGRSGTGKSTHSRLWLSNIEGSTMLNDDNPVVRITGGRAVVYGTPWSGKTACYRNMSAPVAAFVRLRQAGTNHIRRLGPTQAYASLMAGSGTAFGIESLADARARILARLAETTPCMLLECLPDKEAAQLCFHSTAF